MQVQSKILLSLVSLLAGSAVTAPAFAGCFWPAERYSCCNVQYNTNGCASYTNAGGGCGDHANIVPSLACTGATTFRWGDCPANQCAPTSTCQTLSSTWTITNNTTYDLTFQAQCGAAGGFQQSYWLAPGTSESFSCSWNTCGSPATSTLEIQWDRGQSGKTAVPLYQPGPWAFFGSVQTTPGIQLGYAGGTFH